MPEDRDIPAHGGIDLRLAGTIHQMLDAANDVGHAHVVIIDHHGEIVDRRAVRAQDNDVLEILVLEHDAALDHVLDHGLALARGLEADDGLNAGRGFGGIAVAPGAQHHERRLLGLGLGAHRGQIVGREIALVGLSHCQQLARDLGVAARPAELRHDLVVPLQAKPFQAVEDGVDGFRGVAGAVGILDAQQELAAAMARIQPVKQCGSCPADVQEACRRGRKPGNYRLAAGGGGAHGSDRLLFSEWRLRAV